ncbi:MAG: DinB family protein [Chitinophagaceae bacterium]|nr:DinB family protein [Chitinophagaceae bacterium]
MIIDTLKLIFARDLDRLYSEIKSYKREEAMWQVKDQITNSAGNLCLHLLGNLNTYIGSVIGNTGYIRDRDAEFSQKNIPREQLLQQILQTKDMVISTLDLLSESALQEEYPILVFDKKTTTAYLLIHLTTHLTYHLGQINYHRRLIDNM